MWQKFLSLGRGNTAQNFRGALLPYYQLMRQRQSNGCADPTRNIPLTHTHTQHRPCLARAAFSYVPLSLHMYCTTLPSTESLSMPTRRQGEFVLCWARLGNREKEKRKKNNKLKLSCTRGTKFSPLARARSIFFPPFRGMNHSHSHFAIYSEKGLELFFVPKKLNEFFRER